MLVTAFILIAMFSVQAQDKTKVIGNKPRSGSANSSFSVIKGNQVGIKMNAGRKAVQLLKLNFDVSNDGSDSLAFKVNVYEFNGVTPGNNLVTHDITGAIPHGKNAVTVDLSRFNVTAKGNILVAIQWLKSTNVNNHFATGLFNGGTYYYEDDKWKKLPVAGIDFNVLVKKLK